MGANAVGTPPGNNGGAFTSSFTPIITTGEQGASSDFSQGLLISGQAVTALSNADQWKTHLATLVSQMLVLHGMPLPGISRSDFLARGADLSMRVPTLSDAEIRTGLLALVASIQDAHTDVSWPSPSPFRMLPLSFYWFDDGIYVTGAATQYEQLLGGKVLALGTTAIEEATRTLTALVPHENEQWPKKRIPQMEMPNADCLFGMGLTGSIESANILVQTAAGDIVSTDIPSFGSFKMPRIIALQTAGLPLYRQHQDRNYWATVIDEGATIYFQYNSCTEDPRQPSSEFFAQLDQLMALDSVQRIVLDMRLNSGGFTTILAPWIEAIQTSRFNQSGRLYVIVGRATFSAAPPSRPPWRQPTICGTEPTRSSPENRPERSRDSNCGAGTCIAVLRNPCQLLEWHRERERSGSDDDT